MISFAPALQIRGGQQSNTANLGPLTIHIYHVMSIVTGGFPRNLYYYFQEILLSNLELVFLEFKHFYKTHRTSLFSFYLFIFYLIILMNLSSFCSLLTLSNFCTFRITNSTKEKTKSFDLTSTTYRCEI